MPLSAPRPHQAQGARGALLPPDPEHRGTGGLTRHYRIRDGLAGLKAGARHAACGGCGVSPWWQGHAPIPAGPGTPSHLSKASPDPASPRGSRGQGAAGGSGVRVEARPLPRSPRGPPALRAHIGAWQLWGPTREGSPPPHPLRVSQEECPEGLRGWHRSPLRPPPNVDLASAIGGEGSPG